jgi:CBS domain-containing protein
MNEKLATEVSSRLTLDATTASEFMTSSPVSLREDATVHEAVALLTDRGISAAPVIDEAGRPVGVLSLADIVVHVRESGFHVERPGLTRVKDMMTPVVFSIAPDAPARRVVEDMVALKVHRLFVVDADGVLTGVISALDVLNHLHLERPPVLDPVPASACNGPAHAYEIF